MNGSTNRTGEVSSLNFQHCYDAGKVSLAKTDAHNTPTPFMPDGYAIDTFLNCLFKIIYPTSLTLGVPATLSLLSAAIQRHASRRWRISKRNGEAKRGFLRCWQRGRIRLGRSPSLGSVQVRKCGSPKIDCQPVGPCRSPQSNSTPSILVHALSLANQTRMYLLG